MWLLENLVMDVACVCGFHYISIGQGYSPKATAKAAVEL